jgi:hypothetical protein
MKRFLFFLAAFFAMSIRLDAQQPIPLGLKQAVDAAVDQNGNTRIQLAAELVRQAEAKSAQARSALLPDVSASIGQQSQTRSLIAAGFRSEDLPRALRFPVSSDLLIRSMRARPRLRNLSILVRSVTTRPHVLTPTLQSTTTKLRRKTSRPSLPEHI